MFWAEEYAGESKNSLNECAERMINAADACAAMAGMEWNHPRYSRQALKSGYGYKQTCSGPNLTSASPPKADILMAVTDFRL